MNHADRLVVTAGVVLLAGCSSSARPAAAPTSAAATTITAPPTSAAPAPTTTIYSATAPQASPDLAGSHLLAAWRTGDRAAALTAATPAAVDTVFAKPYPAGGVQPRSCAQAVAGPSACVYRVNSGLLSLDAVAAGGGWIIQAATFEG